MIEGQEVGMEPGNSTEGDPDASDSATTPVTQLTIMVDFMDACRRAKTVVEVNVAAGIAREELLDLAEDCFDHLRILFETPSRSSARHQARHN